MRTRQIYSFLTLEKNFPGLCFPPSPTPRCVYPFFACRKASEWCSQFKVSLDKHLNFWISAPDLRSVSKPCSSIHSGKAKLFLCQKNPQQNSLLSLAVSGWGRNSRSSLGVNWQKRLWRWPCKLRFPKFSAIRGSSFNHNWIKSQD